MPGAGLGTESQHSCTLPCHQGATVPQRSLVCAPRCCGAPWGPAWSCVTLTVTALGTTSAAPLAAATSANHPPRVSYRHPVGMRPLCPLPTCHCDPRGTVGSWGLSCSPMGHELNEELTPAGRAAPPPWRGALSPSPFLSLHVPAWPGLCPPAAEIRQPSASSCACRTGTVALSPLLAAALQPDLHPPTVGYSPLQTAASWVQPGGDRGSQGGSTTGCPIPQRRSTEAPSLTTSLASSRYSIAMARRGCTRSCHFRVILHPTAIAPMAEQRCWCTPHLFLCWTLFPGRMAPAVTPMLLVMVPGTPSWDIKGCKLPAPPMAKIPSNPA